MTPLFNKKEITLIKPSIIFNGNTQRADKKVESQFGLKIVSVRSKNANLKLPTVPAFMILLNEDTGFPLVFMDATVLTALRTAAGSGAITDLFASEKNPLVVGVFGAGLQAKYHIEAMLAIRKNIVRIVLFNRTVENAKKLQLRLEQHQKMKNDAPKVVYEAVSIDSAVPTHLPLCDIVITATNSSVPLFEGKYLKKGAHINAIGSYLPNCTELDSETINRRARLIVVDSYAALECGELSGNYKTKQDVIEAGSILQQFGQNMKLQKQDHFNQQFNTQGENVGKDVTIFKSVGVAVQDTASAYAVYKNACKMGKGVQFNFSSSGKTRLEDLVINSSKL